MNFLNFTKKKEEVNVEPIPENQNPTFPNKFRVKVIGKSYVGKTTFINKINNPNFSNDYEKSNIVTNYKINFKYDYKKDIFYFDEEPELNLNDAIYSFDNNSNQNYYAALIFIFNVNEKESLDYILNSYEKIYSSNTYDNVLKVLVSNKNDLDKKLRQVTQEDIDKATKKIKGLFFEISSKNTEQVYNIVSKIYTRVKNLVRVNEYYFGSYNDNAYFIDKEKLMPNYYEIIITGDRDSGKNCLKNKFLYDCSEKTVSLYEYCIPRTINIAGKEIKFDIFIKTDEKAKANELNSEFYYNIFQNLEPNNICILLTYDISNKASFDNLKKIVAEIFDYLDRYKLCISILGLKCDLLLDNELEERIKEGSFLAKSLNAHYYIVSNKTGFNVDNVFYDILVQAYNKYHKNDSIPTTNYYKETVNDENVDIYSDIHVRNEKPKMKEKDKKKVQKQIEKELNNIKKMETQKKLTLNNRKKKENEIYSSQFRDILKANYSKIYRCSKCLKIPKIKINEINNTINVKCMHENKNEQELFKLNEFIDSQNKIPIQCFFCKNGNINHLNSFDYCNNCAKLFCKKCDNMHKISKECEDKKRDILPFYLLESFCNVHEAPTKYYCVDCKRYVCDICFVKDHQNHNFKFYDKDSVDLLIKENRKLIEKSKLYYKYLESYFYDLINSIKNKFNELMDLKKKKLDIKENIVKNLELYKNNFNLIESVAELQYEEEKLNSLKYSANLKWKDKLDIIFDYLNEPLYIKNTNICIKENVDYPFNILQEIKKQSLEKINQEKEKGKKLKEEQEKKEKEKKEEEDKKEEEKKEEVKNEEEKKEEEKKEEKKEEEKKEEEKNEIKDEMVNEIKEEVSDLSDNLKIEETFINNLKINSTDLTGNNNTVNMEGNPDAILITDICALSNKYFGLSSDDGLLKIYRADNYMEKPYNTIKEYLPNKGIYSLYKPNKEIHVDFNPLYLIGFEIIKKLIFDNEYKRYNIPEEYKIDNCYFTNMIELLDLNGILISTLDQSIINVYKNKEKKIIKTDITYMLNEQKSNKIIENISEIGSNTFNIKLADENKEEEMDIDKNVNKEKYRLRRRTIGNRLRKEENQNEEEEETKSVNKKNIYNIILELNQDEKTSEISLKSTYEFYKNFDIIGKICTHYLLVIDKNIETIPMILHLFDYNNFTFIKRYYLDHSIPVLYYTLENFYCDNDIFLLLDNKMNLIQYSFDDDKNQEIKALFSFDLKEVITKKNKDDNIILLNVGDKLFLFANNGLIFKINN